jgi:hypothetical protein
MRKYVENMKNGNFWLKLPLTRLFLSKNMPHRKCTHFKIFVASKELRACLMLLSIFDFRKCYYFCEVRMCTCEHMYMYVPL